MCIRSVENVTHIKHHNYVDYVNFSRIKTIICSKVNYTKDQLTNLQTYPCTQQMIYPLRIYVLYLEQAAKKLVMK